MATFADTTATYASALVTFGLAPGSVLTPAPILSVLGTLAPTGVANPIRIGGLRASGTVSASLTPVLLGSLRGLKASKTVAATGTAQPARVPSFFASGSPVVAGTAKLGGLRGLKASGSPVAVGTASTTAVQGLGAQSATSAFGVITPVGTASPKGTIRPLSALASVTPGSLAFLGARRSLQAQGTASPLGVVAFSGNRVINGAIGSLRPLGVAQAVNRRALQALGTAGVKTGLAFPTNGKTGDYASLTSTYLNPYGTYAGFVTTRLNDLRASAFLTPSTSASPTVLGSLHGVAAPVVTGTAFLGSVRSLSASGLVTVTGYVNPTPLPLSNQPGPTTFALFTDGTPRMAFRLQRLINQGVLTASATLVTSGLVFLNARRALLASGVVVPGGGSLLSRNVTLQANGHAIPTGFADTTSTAPVTRNAQVHAAGTLIPLGAVRVLGNRRVLHAASGTATFVSGSAAPGVNSTVVNTSVTVAAPSGVTSITFDPNA